MSFFAFFIGFSSSGNVWENAVITVFKRASASAVGGFGLQTLRSVIDSSGGVFRYLLFNSVK